MGGDINPAEPVCEYPETRLRDVAALEKVNLFQFYISSCSIQKLMTQGCYCNIVKGYMPYLQKPAALWLFDIHSVLSNT